jgi:hypothetical protein
MARLTQTRQMKETMQTQRQCARATLELIWRQARETLQSQNFAYRSAQTRPDAKTRLITKITRRIRSNKNL